MSLAQLQSELAGRAYDFDTFFRWRSREGRIVPAVRREAVQLRTSESYLHDDASVLFLNPSPCLDALYADDFDILCEGDSWLCLSVYPGHVTMAQHLLRSGYAICNIAKYGRTTQDIQDRRAEPTGYLTKLKGPVKAKAFIVSMGGNDFLGDQILTWLRQRQSGDHDPANAPRYVDDEEFEQILGGARLNYVRLIANVKKFSPDTTVLLQTYTYAAGPTHLDGAFLGRFFTARGFGALDPNLDALNKAIVKLVIDRFHAMLVELKETSAVKIEIVDFRRMLQPSDIRDEIHPKPGKAAEMAAAYVPFLEGAGVEPRALVS
jgi:hypothetical protein